MFGTKKRPNKYQVGDKVYVLSGYEVILDTVTSVTVIEKALGKDIRYKLRKTPTSHYDGDFIQDDLYDSAEEAGRGKLSKILENSDQALRAIRDEYREEINEIRRERSTMQDLHKEMLHLKMELDSSKRKPRQ